MTNRSKVLSRKSRSSQAPAPAAPAASLMIRLSSGSLAVWAGAALIVAAVVLIYWQTLGGPFILDDPLAIQGNPTIHQLWPLWGPLHPPSGAGQTVEGRPIVNLTLAINYAILQDSPAGYRVGNILIHALAALALFGVLRRTFLRIGLGGKDGAAGAFGLAFASALLWAVHPLQTESVAYIVQRAESLMGLLFLLTLYAFIRSCGDGEGSPPVSGFRRGAWLFLAVAACTLGMGSKEVMVSAPILVLLYDRTFVSGSLDRALRARPVAYAGLALTWGLLLYLVIGAGSRGQTIGSVAGISPWGYALCQFRGIIHYLRLCYIPVGQVFDYGPDVVTHPISVLPHALAVIALVGLSLWGLCDGAGTAGCRLGYLGAWFFLILAPTSSFVGGYRQMLAEHRMYLPLAAVIVLSMAGLRRLAGVRMTIAVLLVLAVPLGVAAYLRSGVYASSESIYGDTVAKRPLNPWAHCNMGYAVGTAGKLDQALDEFKEAIRLKADLPEAHYNLGVVYSWKNRNAEAIKEFEEAIIDRPGYTDAVRMLGILLSEIGRPIAALPYLDQFTRGAPDNVAGWLSAGVAYLRVNRGPEAQSRFEQAIRLDPHSAEAEYDLGLALKGEGRLDEALVHYRKAMALRPNYPEPTYCAGAVIASQGHPQEGLELIDRAIHLKNDFVDARIDRATILHFLGRRNEAIEEYHHIIDLLPNSPDAYYRLGVVLTENGQVDEAIPQLERALELRPNFPDARRALDQAQALKEKSGL